MPEPLYGLPDTSQAIFDRFRRVNLGKSTSEDFEILGKHIESKKKDIREARLKLDMDGRKSPPVCRQKRTFDSLLDILDGGWR